MKRVPKSKNGHRSGGVALPTFPNRWMSQDEMREYLEAGVEEAKKLGHTLDEFAAAIGITAGHLRNIIARRSNAGMKTGSGLDLEMQRFGKPVRRR